MATTNTKNRKLHMTPPEAVAQASEQANEYDSIFGDTELPLPNGGSIMVPPHPDYGMLDDDRLDEWDELKFQVDTEYEREEDVFIPEQHLDGGVTLPSTTLPGKVKVPFRIKGAGGKSELVKPAHSVRTVQIALGPEEYAKLKAGGGNAKDVWRIWGRQSILIKERQQSDSKSAGSTVDLAAVPAADSE